MFVSPTKNCSIQTRKVDIRLSEEKNSNSYGARPVHQILLMIK